MIKKERSSTVKPQTLGSVQLKSFNLNLQGGKNRDMLVVARGRLSAEIARKRKEVKRVTLSIKRSNKSSLGLLKRNS